MGLTTTVVANRFRKKDLKTMMSSSRICVLTSAIVVSLGLVSAPTAFAQDKMSKDGMKKDDAMSKDGMKKDEAMSKDSMKKDDAMSKDGMKKDEAMSKDNMKKDETKK